MNILIIRRNSFIRTIVLLLAAGAALSAQAAPTAADDFGSYYSYGWEGGGQSQYDWYPWEWMDPGKMSEWERSRYYYEIHLYDRKGALVDTNYILKGSELQLPSLASTKGYTFMGWDTEKNKSVDPRYEARQTITPSDNMELYSVWFRRSTEENLKKNAIMQVKKSLYKEAIFVGDSRMMRTRIRLNSLYGAGKYEKNLRIRFVAVGAQTLNNFRTAGDAYSEKALLRMVKADNEKKGKPIAVVFCLGVNDLHRVTNASGVVSKYISYLNRLKKKLEAYNVRLFFMSTNPVNGGLCSFIYEDGIRAFNEGMAASLPEGYAFINSYKWLMKTGFSTNAGKQEDTGEDDGIHYSTATYKRILNYAIRFINRG